MPNTAYALIAEIAPPNDGARLRATYDEVRSLLGSRVGHDEDFERRLAALIVMVGGKRPDVDPVALAQIVYRTYQAPKDQE